MGLLADSVEKLLKKTQTNRKPLKNRRTICLTGRIFDAVFIKRGRKLRRSSGHVFSLVFFFFFLWPHFDFEDNF